MSKYTTKNIRRETVDFIEQLASVEKRTFSQQLERILEQWAKDHPEQAGRAHASHRS